MYKKLTLQQETLLPRLIQYPDCQTDFCSNIIKTSHYTWYNFIFLNIFEQFHRFANLFFLFLAIIQAIPSISPLNQFAGFVQLIFMLSITAVKNGYEDYLRHKTDKEVNDRLVSVYHKNSSSGVNYTFTKWSDLKVSNVIKIDPNTEIPADCIVIETFSKENKCRIESSALDGETNLKYRYPIFMSNCNLTKDDHFLIEISPPTSNLKVFSGKIIDSDGIQIPISVSNFIPRGCISRDTQPFLAIVVYTGDDTKLIMNSMKPRFKFTELDRIMSIMAFVLLNVMFLICFILALCSKHWTKTQKNSNQADDYLLYVLNDNQHWFLQFFSWIIDLQMIIPLAVYSSLDIVRFLLSFNVLMDEKMSVTTSTEMNETVVKKSKCRNSDLVSTIGRVTHIFTDKTGTLTKNKMSLHSVSFENYVFDINQVDIENSTEEISLEYLIDHSQSNADLFNFFMTILLCNSVEVIDNQNISNSPDELALLNFAKRCGFELIDSNSQKAIILWNNARMEIDRPIRFEFTSQRKRSSVLCKIHDHWLLLVKGADISIIPRCNNYNSIYEKRLNDLGAKGLRTLCYAYKELNENDAISLIKEFEIKQSKSIQSDEEIELLSDIVESGLTLFAFSGVEDELQDHVQETLEIIHNANIKVWMLTGDRLDTAIDVGRNCGLIQPFNSIISINAISQPQENDLTDTDLNSDVLSELEFKVNGKVIDIFTDELEMENSVLCVDEINLIMDDLRIFNLANQCSSVIIARCEPLQKGNCLRYFKENIKNIEKMKTSALSLSDLQTLNSSNVTSIEETTFHKFFNFAEQFFHLKHLPIVLAIGDGVNDVDMIRCADVGIGVESREGSAAVLSSDYSIPTFSKLARLLIVHGRWNSIRTSLLVLVTFYKNLLLGLPQLFYGFYNGFSATSIYDSGYFSMYNAILTVPQHFAACVFEEDIEDSICLKYPQVYCDYQYNGGFNFFSIFLTYFLSVFHSFLIFYIPYFSFNLAILNGNFVTFDHSLLTQIVGWTLMSIFTYEMFHMFHSVTLFQSLLNIACFLSNFVIQYLYSFAEGEYDQILTRSRNATLMWFSIPLSVGIAVIIDMIIDYLKPFLVKSFTQNVINRKQF